MNLFCCPDCCIFVDSHGIPLDPQPDLAPKLGPDRHLRCPGCRLRASQRRVRVVKRLADSPAGRMPYSDL